MNWENLKSNKCPHCSAELEIVDGQVRCTACRFFMSRGLFEQKLTYREYKPTVHIRYFWQNLKDDRCPICANFLIKKSIGMLRCMSATCDFHVTEEQLQKWMDNPLHAMHRYPREKV